MRKTPAATRQPDAAAPTVFFVFTILGVLYILMAKISGFPPIVVTLVPVFIMAGYALMILFARALRLRDDQTGDNFYYMGFIFTLASLAVSLYQYSSGGAVDEIVRNFGIAVASTIAGIAFRIFFNQIRRDPIEVEHVSRLELAEASRRVRKELEGVILEFTHFRRSNQQILQEAFTDARAHMEGAAREASRALAAVTVEAIEQIRTSSSAIAELDTAAIASGIQQTASAVNAFNQTLTSAGHEIAASSKAVATRLSAMSTPDQVIEIKLEPVVADLQRVIALTGDKLGEQMQQLEALRHQVDAANEAMATSNKQMAMLAKKLTFEFGSRRVGRPLLWWRQKFGPAPAQPKRHDPSP